jgi:hypothetical protein
VKKNFFFKFKNFDLIIYKIKIHRTIAPCLDATNVRPRRLNDNEAAVAGTAAWSLRPAGGGRRPREQGRLAGQWHHRRFEQLLLIVVFFDFVRFINSNNNDDDHPHHHWTVRFDWSSSETGYDCKLHRVKQYQYLLKIGKKIILLFFELLQKKSFSSFKN